MKATNNNQQFKSVITSDLDTAVIPTHSSVSTISDYDSDSDLLVHKDFRKSCQKMIEYYVVYSINNIVKVSKNVFAKLIGVHVSRNNRKFCFVGKFNKTRAVNIVNLYFSSPKISADPEVFCEIFGAYTKTKEFLSAVDNFTVLGNSSLVTNLVKLSNLTMSDVLVYIKEKMIEFLLLPKKGFEYVRDSVLQFFGLFNSAPEMGVTVKNILSAPNFLIRLQQFFFKIS